MSGETPAVREALPVYEIETPETERVPPGYKRTEVGMIPEDWHASPLCDEITLLSGHHVLAQHCNMHGVGVPYLTGPADFPNGQIQQTKFTDKPTTLCERKDILVTVKGSGSGTLTEADAQYCISRQLMSIRVNRWDSRFLYYSLLQNASRIKAASTGLIPGLSRSDILDQEIPVPPLSEQRAIAAALSDVDSLISALDRLIAKKRAVKTAAMQQLLTGKQRLPGFSGEWEVKRLEDVFSFLSTANNPRSDLSEHGEIEYVHYGDLHAADSSFLDCSKAKMPHIARNMVNDIPLLEEGDLIMADASEDYEGVGKSVEVRNLNGRKLVAGLHTFLLRGNKELLADGFKGYLQYIPPVKSALIRLATGISVYGISKNNVRSIEVELPEVEEQRAIATVLSDMDAEIEALETRREKTRRAKQGMMQELLTGRTRLSKGPVHNWAFNEAVVISALANKFGTSKYPLGRKRYTKLAYLLHRRTDGETEGYLKKPAGPYNPATRYKGAESIAQKNGYVRSAQSGKFYGFVPNRNIERALAYFDKWYGKDTLEWLEQFRYKSNEELELLTTVDMAVQELREANQETTVSAVEGVLKESKDWRPKLKKQAFSRTNIQRAISRSRELFS